jgi:hypothetical protein
MQTYTSCGGSPYISSVHCCFCGVNELLGEVHQERIVMRRLTLLTWSARIAFVLHNIEEEDMS